MMLSTSSPMLRAALSALLRICMQRRFGFGMNRSARSSSAKGTVILKAEDVLEIFSSNYLNNSCAITVTDFDFMRENDAVKINITFKFFILKIMKKLTQIYSNHKFLYYLSMDFLTLVMDGFVMVKHAHFLS